MSLLRPRVRDDRGRRVRLAPLIGREGRAVRRAALRRAVWVVVVIAAGVGGFVVSWFAWTPPHLLAISLTIGFEGYFSEADAARFDLWMWVFIPGFFLSIIPSTLLVLHPVWRWRARAGARRAGLCAACGYALAGLASDLDGCTVCPECGAAWRLGGPSS